MLNNDKCQSRCKPWWEQRSPSLGRRCPAVALAALAALEPSVNWLNVNRDVFSPRGRATDTSGVLYSDDITLIKEFIFIVEVNQLQLCCDSWKCAALRRWPLIPASRHRHATGRTPRAKNPVTHRWASARPFASLISFYLSWPLNRSVQRAASQRTKAKSSQGMSNGAALVI